MNIAKVEPDDWHLGDVDEKRVAKVGEFTVKSFIGQGGNGYAYYAEHSLLGPVVLKIDRQPISSRSLTFIEQEISAHDILSRHPNCSKLITCLLGAFTATFYDHLTKTSSTHSVLVLERMEGDAYTLVIRTRRLPTYKPTVAELLELCFYIHILMVKQLRFIHSRGLVHGDVKPQNVLFRRDGTNEIEMKMSDLGTACNPLRDCKKQYGCTHFFRSPTYARNATMRVLNPPTRIRIDNDFFGCAISLPVLMMAAGLLPYVSDGWSEQDRCDLIANFAAFKSGMPIVDIAIAAIHQAIRTQDYTDRTYEAAVVALERLKAAAAIPRPISHKTPSVSTSGAKILTASAALSSLTTTEKLSSTMSLTTTEKLSSSLLASLPPNN